VGKKKRKSSRKTSKQAQAIQFKKSTRASFNPDYSYVVKDLKRIALIAGILILGLIGLSFVL